PCCDRYTAYSCVLVFFFFQAEDGIRDFHVTGVQTCALPISSAAADHLGGGRHRHRLADHAVRLPRAGALDSPFLRRDAGRARRRSEERRVGKECRWRWVADAKI